MCREESMKKLIVFLFSLILSVVFSTSASAYDVKVDGIYYLLIKGKIAEVTRNVEVEYSGEVVIPSSITVEGKEYTVTSIGVNAFREDFGLTSVTIPNSVTSIGEYAFQGCSGLTSVTIPNSVTSIGEMAFYDCSGLKSVTIGNSVTSIGNATFYLCRSLKSVTIGNSVTSIGDRAFGGCSGLTSVTIPNSVTSIGDYAFGSCKGLTSITIPNSVTSIGKQAFYECYSLTSVIIPNSVKSIEASTFYGCSGLKSVTIGNSVTSIGEEVFSYCSGLTSVTIPNSVTSIGEWAFQGCTGLTSVTIPNSVTSIAGGAFKGCSGLTSVIIPNSVQSIGIWAFRDCSKLEDVYCYAENVPSTNDSAFEESYIEYSTLHVPGSALSSYKTTAPWSGFGTIKALEGTEAKKCEKPVISYNNGELDFTCSTEGVEFASEIKCDDVKKFNTSKISLSACYDISVTATKAGYKDSDVATAKLYWLPTSDIGTNINTAKTRGVVIQSAGGFITLSGLETNERVQFFAIDGAALGSATATDGTATFSAKSGTIVVAKIGKKSVKIAVE